MQKSSPKALLNTISNILSLDFVRKSGTENVSTISCPTTSFTLQNNQNSGTIDMKTYTPLSVSSTGTALTAPLTITNGTYPAGQPKRDYAMNVINVLEFGANPDVNSDADSTSAFCNSICNKLCTESYINWKLFITRELHNLHTIWCIPNNITRHSSYKQCLWVNKATENQY